MAIPVIPTIVYLPIIDEYMNPTSIQYAQIENIPVVSGAKTNQPRYHFSIHYMLGDPFVREFTTRDEAYDALQRISDALHPAFCSLVELPYFGVWAVPSNIKEIHVDEPWVTGLKTWQVVLTFNNQDKFTSNCMTQLDANQIISTVTTTINNTMNITNMILNQAVLDDVDVPEDMDGGTF